MNLEILLLVVMGFYALGIVYGSNFDIELDSKYRNLYRLKTIPLMEKIYFSIKMTLLYLIIPIRYSFMICFAIGMIGYMILYAIVRLFKIYITEYSETKTAAYISTLIKMSDIYQTKKSIVEKYTGEKHTPYFK